MTPRFITVHETANPDPGANAVMHREFVNNGGGREGVSFHYCVDDLQAIEIVPPSVNAWHAGDGYNGTGNRSSIGIETCINAGADWEQTKENLARLIVSLMRRHRIPLDKIVQHNHWSGKDCPHVLRLAPPQWNQLMQRIEELAGQGSPVENIYFKETGHYISHGFLRYWQENGGLVAFGYPKSEEYTRDDGITVQWFERARFELQPAIATNPWGVVEGLTGNEALAVSPDPAKFADRFAYIEKEG